MPSPIYVPGALNGLIAPIVLPPGRNCAAYLPATGVDTQVTISILTGVTTPTVSPSVQVYKVYGNGTVPIGGIHAPSPSPGTSILSLSAAAPAGSTSLTVSSTVGIGPNQAIALQQAAGSQLGEIVTTAATQVPSTSPVAVSATGNAYQAGDAVYLIAPTTWGRTITNPYGLVPASTLIPIYFGLDPGQYVVSIWNNDKTALITVAASCDAITAIQ